MTTLYLIRHGETVWNADGRFQGQQDSPLNATGLAQAEIVARRLAATPVDAIYTSDLSRAADTATAIAAYHDIAISPDSRLREASFGEWESLTLPQVTARWPELVAAWRMDSLHTRPPSGETLEQVAARVCEAVCDICRLHPTGNVVVVGHGGSVRAIIAQALGADLSIFRRLRVDNCSISIVQQDQGAFSLGLLNDICHLNTQAPHASWDETGDTWRNALKTP